MSRDQLKPLPTITLKQAIDKNIPDWNYLEDQVLPYDFYACSLPIRRYFRYVDYKADSPYKQTDIAVPMTIARRPGQNPTGTPAPGQNGNDNPACIITCEHVDNIPITDIKADMFDLSHQDIADAWAAAKGLPIYGPRDPAVQAALLDHIEWDIKSDVHRAVPVWKADQTLGRDEFTKIVDQTLDTWLAKQLTDLHKTHGIYQNEDGSIN